MAQTLKMTEAEEAKIYALLKAIQADTQYNTPDRYSPDTKTYPDNIVSYAVSQLAYIKRYPNIDPYQYIENLKLTTRIR